MTILGYEDWPKQAPSWVKPCVETIYSCGHRGTKGESLSFADPTGDVSEHYGLKTFVHSAETCGSCHLFTEEETRTATR